MDITTIMVFLGLVWTVCSTSVCRADCELTSKSSGILLEYQHVSDLRNTSVAPWKVSENRVPDREPEHILYADCKKGTENDSIIKPIYIQIKVYEKIRHGSNITWCKCPFDLAVGCTLLKKPQ